LNAQPKKMIQIFTGEGAGKTSASLGRALRALGHGRKVMLVQFMKGRRGIGEVKIQKRLPKLQVHQFGRRNFVNLENPSRRDKEIAKKGLEFLKQLKKWPDILILDELCLAVSIGLVSEKEALEVLKLIPRKTDTYVTGRKASKKLKEFADIVCKIELVKGPENWKARKGIEY